MNYRQIEFSDSDCLDVHGVIHSEMLGPEVAFKGYKISDGVDRLLRERSMIIEGLFSKGSAGVKRYEIGPLLLPVVYQACE